MISLDFREYQLRANRTAGPLLGDERLKRAALGLCGESGEFADRVKKVVYHGHPMDVRLLVLELGDIQWYLADGASALEVSLEDVALRNLQKLQERYPNGFSSERSIARVDV